MALFENKVLVPGTPNHLLHCTMIINCLKWVHTPFFENQPHDVGNPVLEPSSGPEMVGSCQMQHPLFACTLLTGGGVDVWQRGHDQD